MLRVGLDKVHRAHLDARIALVRGDATRIPLPDASVDGVTIGFGIRNVEDTAAACREIARVLTTDGRLAILEFAVPTFPIVRQAYAFYFNHVLPAIGRLVSRHNAAYGYLPASVGAFAAPQEFAALLRDTGFIDVHSKPLTFGIVYLYTARREGSERAQRVAG
jgi:demethylmenaquinone methyltransferase/2-methoxy-6-polyprenyl-1,4-benzoquinol methylase